MSNAFHACFSAAECVITVAKWRTCMQHTTHTLAGQLCYHSDAICCCHLSQMQNARFYVKACLTVLTLAEEWCIHIWNKSSAPFSMQTYLSLYVKLIGWGQTLFRLYFVLVVMSGYDRRAQSSRHVFEYMYSHIVWQNMFSYKVSGNVLTTFTNDYIRTWY